MGPGVQVAKIVGDCAAGGQVVLTEEAWEELRHFMGLAGWPVVEHLGVFKHKSLSSWLLPLY